MSDVAPITTQPVKISGFGREDESGENEEERKKNETCWQRLCAAFNHCCANMTDCLDFWCCKNECYNFCCNYNDIDDDDEDAAEVGLNSNGGEQAVMTVIKEVVENQGNENQESYTKLDLDSSEIQLAGDKDEKHSSDHSGGSQDKSEGHHKGHAGGHHDHSGGHQDHSGGHHEHAGGHHDQSVAHHDHSVAHDDHSGGNHGVDHSVGHNDAGHSGVDHGGYTGGGDSGGGGSGGGDCGGCD